MSAQSILHSRDLQDPVTFEPMEEAVTIWPCGHLFNEKTVMSLRERNLPCSLDRIPIQDFVINHNIRNLVKNAQNQESEPPSEQAVALYKEAKKLKHRAEYAGAASLFFQASNLSPNYTKAIRSVETCLAALKKEKVLAFEYNSLISQVSQKRYEKNFSKLPATAQSWLRICSYFDNTEIPISYLESWLTIEQSSESKENILTCLSVGGFIERHEELLYMHRYVHDAIRTIEDGTRLDNTFLLLFGEVEWDLDEGSNPKKELEKASIWAKHALAFTKHPRFSQAPLRAQEFFFTGLGRYLEEIDQFKDAIVFYEKALHARIEAFGGNHPDVAEILSDIGDCLFSLREYQDALFYYEEALTISKKSFGEESEEVAQVLDDIAQCHEFVGNYPEAIASYNQKFEIIKSLLGEDHTNAIEASNEISRLEELMQIIQEVSYETN